MNKVLNENEREMFKKMQNIDTAFRYIRGFSLAIIAGVILMAALVVIKSFTLAAAMQGKIYVLANGKALEAYASDRKDNVGIEARDHIKTFHHLFFTLSPDEKAINENMTRSFYLADISAKQQYDNLKESNFFSNVISGNVTQSLHVDSVHLDLDRTPFYFRCYSTQTITRTTSVATRSLVTDGVLREVSRTENNSHGFLIERWQVLENKDIEVRKRMQ